MGILEWLEHTPFAAFVGESLWAYPFFLSLHVIGLAIVVGIFIMLDLKLLGFFKTVRASAFLSLFKLAWTGFIINAISGASLFAAQATYFITSTPFLIKIAMIFVGAILAAVLQSKLRTYRDANDALEIDSKTKILAIVSLTAWLGAIITGRLIAYL